MRVSLLGCCLLCLSGCGVGHLWHLAVGQTKLLIQRRSVSHVLQEANLSEVELAKIRLILNVREFAITHLGLYNSGTYLTFVRLDSPYVSYNLSAAPKDAIRPYVWHYPIIGSLPYQGFFCKEYALRAAQKLQRQGYDTYVRGVGTYSTLGYFNDPILSSMLGYPDFVLVDTVIHEMLHQTVWVKGSVSFNESLANFVGEKGTMAYLAWRYGKESNAYQDFIDQRADAEVFREYMHALTTRLDALYQEPISREDKLRRRETIFREAIENYPAIFPRMHTSYYQRFFDRRTLNNALLLSFRVYNRDTTYFEKAFAAHGGDLRRMIEYFKTLHANQIPEKFRTR